MTLASLVNLARIVGFPDPQLAAAVAMAESRGDPAATNIVTSPAPGNLPERSFGLWQVNTLAHPEWRAREFELLDPFVNARAALAISSNGTTWHWWSTFTSGAYRQWMGGSA